ncbi:MAG: histidine ammonia-lyase [Chloroflexota bacterium]|nr:MAG: histidine ammonia-lyase [Chloroflexota bacterium]
MRVIELDGDGLTIDDVAAVAAAWRQPAEVTVRVSPASLEKVKRSRQAVEDFLARGEIIYGITTGFGDFKDRLIPLDKVQQLQRNIIMSHAVGVGPLLDAPAVRAMMLIRAQTLVKGYSGVRPAVIDTLVAMINRGVYPVIPTQGSLGASGDLAPLAHMALPLIGEGEAFYQGERLPGAEAMRRAGIVPLELAAKEGLALTNGTSFMCAVGALTVARAEMLAATADIAAALSLEALRGTPAAFDERIHAVRAHPGQAASAAFLRRLLQGSDFLRSFDPLDVQDAYSLRCTPQVHGAARDAIAQGRHTLEVEMNSANDNPLIFVDEDGATVLSGGNFHGEPVALVMDYLKIALAEIANISERRLARLIDEKVNKRVLPAFLTREGGLNSGFMIVQYTSAALVSENKVLAHPASVDSIPSSANAEDHVSMGSIAARQAAEIAGNLENVLALELFAAAQGIHFRLETLGAGARLGQGTAAVYRLIRSRVPVIEADTVMYPHVEALRELVETGAVARAAGAVLESE